VIGAATAGRANSGPSGIRGDGGEMTCLRHRDRLKMHTPKSAARRSRRRIRFMLGAACDPLQAVIDARGNGLPTDRSRRTLARTGAGGVIGTQAGCVRDTSSDHLGPQSDRVGDPISTVDREK